MKFAAIASSMFFTACVHFPDYRVLVTAHPSERVVIHDVSVFTATSNELLAHQDVLVDRGLIAAMTPTADAPKDAVVIDGRGKTLLPGLVDMHVHTTASSAPPWYLSVPNPEHSLQAHLYAGVTAVADVGGAAEDLRNERRHLAEGQWLGPRLFYAGSILTHRGGYPASMVRRVYGGLAAALENDKLYTQIDTPEQAALEVRRRWAEGASLIKVVVADLPHGAPRLTDAELDAIVAQAHQLGLRVTAHIDSAEDAMIAAKHGVDIFAHGIITSALTDEQVAFFVKSGTIVTPTNINYDLFTRIAQGRYQPNSITRGAEPASLLAEFDHAKVSAAAKTMDPGFYDWGDAIEKHDADRKRNLFMLYKAGVPLIVGTDANGSFGTFAGDIHDELRLWVEAGIPAAETLIAATARPARLLEVKPSFGTIEVGKSADLLLINGNPLENIEKTKDIAMVMVRGQRLDRTSP